MQHYCILQLLPLIEKVNPDQSVKQSWYTSAAGSVSKLRKWYNALVTHGPKFGQPIKDTLTDN
jgi:hypothetical protein